MERKWFFFQAQEGQVVGHGQACARSVGSVGATAVIYRSQPEKRSACLHFCADGFFLGGHTFVIPLMTARNDPRRAVLFGEVGNRQHELQASLATILRMPPERSGIVAMQGLKTLSRPDLYRLGHAQLDIGRDLDPIVPYPDMGGSLQYLLCRLEEQGFSATSTAESLFARIRAVRRVWVPAK